MADHAEMIGILAGDRRFEQRSDRPQCTTDNR